MAHDKLDKILEFIDCDYCGMDDKCGCESIRAEAKSSIIEYMKSLVPEERECICEEKETDCTFGSRCHCNHIGHNACRKIMLGRLEE